MDLIAELRKHAHTTFGPKDGVFPYEIHITVKCDDQTVSQFKQDCMMVDVKPLVVQLGEGKKMHDVMTSSKLKTNPTRLIDYCARLHDYLVERGYVVLRLKIETVPWHPFIVEDFPKQMLKSQYFESHIPVIVDQSTDLDTLRRICDLENMHLSSNAFKVNGTERTIMITYRDRRYSGLEFPLVVKNKCLLLQKMGFKIEEPEVEFAIYDSNHFHDDEWINSNTRV